MTCYRCTAPNASTVVIQHNETDVASGALCDSCFESRAEESRMLREEFEGLIEAGLSRDEASRMMVCKIDGKGPRA